MSLCFYVKVLCTHVQPSIILAAKHIQGAGVEVSSPLARGGVHTSYSNIVTRDSQQRSQSFAPAHWIIYSDYLLFPIYWPPTPPSLPLPPHPLTGLPALNMVSLIRPQPISTDISVAFTILGLSAVVGVRPPGFMWVLLTKFINTDISSSISFNHVEKTSNYMSALTLV